MDLAVVREGRHEPGGEACRRGLGWRQEGGGSQVHCLLAPTAVSSAVCPGSAISGPLESLSASGPNGPGEHWVVVCSAVVTRKIHSCSSSSDPSCLLRGRTGPRSFLTYRPRGKERPEIHFWFCTPKVAPRPLFSTVYNIVADFAYPSSAFWVHLTNIHSVHPDCAPTTCQTPF